MGGNLCMIHLGGKFLPICGPVKLENKLLTLKILWCDEDQVQVIDILVQKEGKKKEIPSNFKIH